MGVILNPFTGELEVVKPTTGFLTKNLADTYYYPLSTNPAGYLTSASGSSLFLKLDQTTPQTIINQLIVTAVDADYVWINDTSDGGKLKKALKSDFSGGSQTPWTSNIDAAHYNLSNVGNISAVGVKPSITSNQSGTNGLSILSVVGGAGGDTSYTGSGPAQAGYGETISITSGLGGSTTGTPATGTGGAGGLFMLMGGDGGYGKTYGGAGGSIEIKGGSGGVGGAFSGAGGYSSLKGGNAPVSGNASGGNVFIVGGIPNGTGSVGDVYLGVSPSFTVRGDIIIGNTLNDGSGNILQVNGGTGIANNLTVIGYTSLDNNAIYTDGAGNLSVTNYLYVNYLQSQNSGSIYSYSNMDLGGNSLYGAGAIYTDNLNAYSGTIYVNSDVNFNNNIKTPNMPNYDLHDGQGTLWYDPATNIVYRGT